MPRTYDECVDEIRRLVEEMTPRWWALGDLALEAVPWGGEDAAAQLCRVADTVGLSLRSLLSYYETAHAFPDEKRVYTVAFAVHVALSLRPDRFKLLASARRHDWNAQQAEAAARRPAPEPRAPKATGKAASKAGAAPPEPEPVYPEDMDPIDAMTLEEVQAFNVDLAEQNLKYDRRQIHRMLAGALGSLVSADGMMQTFEGDLDFVGPLLDRIEEQVAAMRRPVVVST